MTSSEGIATGSWGAQQSRFREDLRRTRCSLEDSGPMESGPPNRAERVGQGFINEASSQDP